MKLNENYRIVSTDTLNITLQRRNKKEDGTFTGWSNVGYYSDFKEALKAFVKKEILGEGLEDYKTICIKIDSLYDLISNLGEVEVAKDEQQGSC